MEKKVDEKSLNPDEPYFDESKLHENHELAREQALLQVKITVEE